MYIAQRNLGHQRQRSHDQSRKQSRSAIRGNGATNDDRSYKQSSSVIRSKEATIAYAKQLVHSRNEPTIDRACTWTPYSLGNDQRTRFHNQSWLLCRRQPICFRCVIDRGFVDSDGRAALRTRSIVGLLPRMAGLGCGILEDCVRIRGLPARSLDY